MKTIGDLVEYCIEVTKETKSDVFFEYSAHIQEINIRMYPEGYENDDQDCFWYPHKENQSYGSVSISNKSKQKINTIVNNVIKWIDLLGLEE